MLICVWSYRPDVGLMSYKTAVELGHRQQPSSARYPFYHGIYIILYAYVLSGYLFIFCIKLKKKITFVFNFMVKIRKSNRYIVVF